MSLQSAAIIPRHIFVDDVCVALRRLPGVSEVGARQMTRPEYQLIEFVRGNQRAAIHAFLSSYASQDYEELIDGESVLLTMEASAENAQLLAELAGTGGWVRSSDRDPWRAI
jgi:hypothetical protein